MTSLAPIDGILIPTLAHLGISDQCIYSLSAWVLLHLCSQKKEIVTEQVTCLKGGP